MKRWLWKCPVDGCTSKSNRPGRQSGSYRPKSKTVARKYGLRHMKEKHPGLDPHSVILEAK